MTSDDALLWAREHMLEGASEMAINAVAIAYRAGHAARQSEADARVKALEAENERLRAFVHALATNPRKPATWMQTREAAAEFLAALEGRQQ